MKKWKLIIRELSNYFYLKRVIKRESSSKDPNSLWKKYNLRKNWYGRIYTVISLREQDMGEEEIVRNWRAMEMMRPINEYLTSLDLQEIIFPSIEQIPNSRSYLVVYSPIIKELTVGVVLRYIFFLALLISLSYILIKKVF